MTADLILSHLAAFLAGFAVMALVVERDHNRAGARVRADREARGVDLCPVCGAVDPEVESCETCAGSGEVRHVRDP